MEPSQSLGPTGSPDGYPRDAASIRALYGGAIGAALPDRYKDVSDLREVPDNQEAFSDLDRDESIIVELLEQKNDVEDADAARWFMEDLANVQSAGSLEIESIKTLSGEDMPGIDADTFRALAIGTMNIVKERQGNDAANLVRVYLAVVRLREVGTDLLIVANEPLEINPRSVSRRISGPGRTVPAGEVGLTPPLEVLKMVLKTFQINDWDLFTTESS